MLRKTQFESLANELIHEVFDYLSPGDVMSSFSHLNRRFTRLISQRLFRLDFSQLSKPEFEYVQQIIPMNQIDTLKLSTKWTVNILSRISFDMMTHLRTLVVSHVNYKELRSLFDSKHFSSLEQLTTLKIQSSNVNGLDRERVFVLKKIFSQMPKLRICQIPLIDVNDFDDLSPTATLSDLTIDYCTIIALGK